MTRYWPRGARNFLRHPGGPFYPVVVLLRLPLHVVSIREDAEKVLASIPIVAHFCAEDYACSKDYTADARGPLSGCMET